MGRLAAACQVSFKASPSSGTAQGDPTRLRQVMLIVLDNALRHTPPGGMISLEARANAREVQFVVQDSGRGISPEQLPHVFERFYQGDETGSGSGLGLAIAKALIEAMQGQISITSRVGAGTQVTFSLPAIG